MEILRSPRAAILKVAGINCDEETAYAFDKAGAKSEIIHLNQFKNGEYEINDYSIIVVPGGFSYGDDIASGRIMALELGTYLGDQLMEHVRQDRVVMGICNGFQVLVQSGLLPFGEITKLNKIRASLEPNDCGHYLSKWVWVKPEESLCPITQSEGIFMLPIAHGEGRFVAREEDLAQIEKNGQVMLRYYSENPNGSVHGIAGICDPSGKIIGLMPHPERCVETFHHNPPGGLEFIKGVVNLVK